MGRNLCSSTLNWSTMVISGASFLNFLLEESGNGREAGIVLQVDNCREAQRLACLFRDKLGAYITQTVSTRMKYPPNFLPLFYVYRNSTSEHEVEEFLQKTDFLPVVVCGGMIPDAFRETAFVFRIELDEIDETIEPFSEIFHEFCDFVVGNIEAVWQSLLEVESSTALTESQIEVEYSGIFRNFIATGMIWKNFFRSKMLEREAAEFFENYLSETKRQIEKIAEFSDGIEIKAIFKMLVWEYAKANENFIFADIEKVDGKVESAINAQSAILYDMEFYFMSEKIFKNIVRPALDTISVTMIKKLLRDEGILACNADNFTVKRMYTNVYGMKKRIRVMKFCKEMLLSEEGLLLEEVFKTLTKTVY